MHLYRELTQPTVVSHSLACDLSGRGYNGDLVVVRGGSLLQLFELQSSLVAEAAVSASLPIEGDISETAELIQETRKTRKLVLVTESPLDGTVTGVQIVCRPDRPRKQLLAISFKYAKVVVLEWEPSLLRFKSLSMHYYEKDLLEDHFANPKFAAKLIVDPSFDALTLLCQKDRLAMLTFPRQIEDEEDTMDTEPFLPSFILGSTNLDITCTNIIDIAYLCDYKEPTIGVIFQPSRSWTGMLPVVKDNVVFLVLSVDFHRQCSTPVVSIKDLPYDLTQIVPLAGSLNGSLLIGGNELVYVESSGRTLALAVNQFAALGSDSPMSQTYTHLELQLDGARALQLPDTSDVLMVLKSGELYRLTFHVESSQVYSIDLAAVPLSRRITNPTTLAAVDGSVFVGSKDASAVLLSYSYDHVNGTAEVAEVAEDADADGAAADDADEVDALYTHTAEAGKLVLQVDDMLISTGPISSLCNTPDALVASCGAGVHGGLTVFQPTVTPIIVDRFTLGDPWRVWALGSYLVTTDGDGSGLYKAPELNLVEDTGFDNQVLTLTVAAHGSQVIHVYETGAKIYDPEFKVVASVQFPGPATDAHICGAKVVASFAGRVAVFDGSNELKPMEIPHIEAESTAVSQEKLAFSRAGHIAMYDWASKETHWYDFGSLDKIVTPTLKEALGESDPVSRFIFCQLGDNVASFNALVILTGKLLTIYQQLPDRKYLKVFSTLLESPDCDLVPVEYGKYSAVLATGQFPQLFLKSASSPVRCLDFNTRRIVSVGMLDTEIMFMDSRGVIYLAQLDESYDLTALSWPHKFMSIGSTVTTVAYHSGTDMLVVGTNVPTQRAALDDSGAEMEGTIENCQKGCTYTGSIKLIIPETLTVVDTVELPQYEAIVSMKNVRLELGVRSDLSKEVVVVGSAILLDEESMSNGHVMVFNVARRAPRQDQKFDVEGPEYFLEESLRELVRGAVSAICETVGRLVTGQGQRVLVRGIIDEQKLEPIAFLDTDIYISDLKAVRNLVALGDSVAGVSLLYYGIEPFRLEVMAKDYSRNFGVTSLDFVSSGDRNDLCIVAADAAGHIRLLQYDPDMPQSLGGTHLVTQSEMYIGRTANCMLMIDGEGKGDLATIGGTDDGALIYVEPMDETSYRALFVVTQQMADKEQQFACLNPRMYRTTGSDVVSLQPLIDGDMARRFLLLSRERQLNYSRKLGQNGLDQVFDALRRDLDL